MKKLLLLFLIVFAVALFAGCIPTVPSDIKDIEVKVTSFQQDAYCGANKGDVKIYTVFNGEKCVPDCASCCPECEECEGCEECEECPTCPECPQCQECPTCPACPACPCYGLKWGDLLVDFQLKNIGDVDVTVEGVCFVITFEDKTTIKKCVDVGEILLIGEEKEKQVEISLSNPIQVIFVEPESIEFN